MLENAGAHVGEGDRLQDEHKKQKEIEAALREKERMLESVFGFFQGGIFALDNKYNLIRVNRTLDTWYAEHYPLKGKKCYKVFLDRKWPCRDCPARRSIVSGRTEMKEATIEGPDEEKRIKVCTFPLTDRYGQRIGVVGFLQDAVLTVAADMQNLPEETAPELYWQLFRSYSCC